MLEPRNSTTTIAIGVIILVVLGGAAAHVAAVAPRATPARIAYVSVQRVATQATAAVAAAKRIQQFREDRTREIATKQKEIEALRLRIAQTGGVFQGAKRAEARQQEAKAVADLQHLEQDSQSQLQTMQRDAQRDFQRDLSTVLADLARTRSADLVLNADTTVVWAQTGMDWTDDVARAINARHPQ